MKLVLIVDGQPQPYSLRQLKADHPQVSFRAVPTDDVLASFGAHVVEETVSPEANYNEELREATAAFVDGRWRQQWRIEPAGVPDRVGVGQFIRAVRSIGRGAQLRSYIKSLPEDDQEDWRTARHIRRAGTMIAGIQAALGVGDKAIANLFRLAASLEEDV